MIIFVLRRGSLRWRGGLTETEGRYVPAQIPYPHARVAGGNPLHAGDHNKLWSRCVQGAQGLCPVVG